MLKTKLHNIIVKKALLFLILLVCLLQFDGTVIHGTRDKLNNESN